MALYNSVNTKQYESVEEALLWHLNRCNPAEMPFVVGYEEDVLKSPESLLDYEVRFFSLAYDVVEEYRCNESREKLEQSLRANPPTTRYIGKTKAAVLYLSALHEDIQDKVFHKETVTLEDLDMYNVYLDTELFVFRSDKRAVEYAVGGNDVVDFIVGKIDRHLDLEDSYSLSFEGFKKEVILGIADELDLQHSNPYALSEIYNSDSSYTFTIDTYTSELYKVTFKSKERRAGRNKLSFVMDEVLGAQCLEFPEVKNDEHISRGYKAAYSDLSKNSMDYSGFEHWYYAEREKFDSEDDTYDGPLYFKPEELAEVEVFIRENKLTDKINYDKFFLYNGEHDYLTGFAEFRAKFVDTKSTPVEFLADIESQLETLLENDFEGRHIQLAKTHALYMYAKYNGVQEKTVASYVERRSPRSDIYVAQSALVVSTDGIMQTADGISEGTYTY